MSRHSSTSTRDLWDLGTDMPLVQPEWCLALLEPPICFYRQFIPLAGSVNGALFLSALVDILSVSHGLPASTLEYSHEDITRRVGLSDKEQRTVRKTLIDAGLISEKRFGIPPRILIKVHVQEVMQRIHQSSDANHDAAASWSGTLGTVL